MTRKECGRLRRRYDDVMRWVLSARRLADAEWDESAGDLSAEIQA